MTTSYRKKLIEVALPLDAINAACADEKAVPRHGHPATLHLWWARRPLAAARAVLFAQLVDDPSAWPERFPTPDEQERERRRLFSIIERMVPWDASNDEGVLREARREIAQSWARSHPSAKADAVLRGVPSPDVVDNYLATEVPPVHDPFAGGGTIPLEAQRLGLRAIATDLNPVAVLINKALIEIPPRFAGRPPVNPESRRSAAMKTWKGAQGLAEDVRQYGAWMRDEAKKRIGHLYPDVEITKEMVRERPDLKPYAGQKLTVIAWLWARTVASPNPAMKAAHVPLVSSFWLSTKEGRKCWVEPVVEKGGRTYRFEVRAGAPKKSDVETIDGGTKAGRAVFRCLLSGDVIDGAYADAEANAGRMSSRLMAIVAEGERGRVYLAPTDDHARVAVVDAVKALDPSKIPGEPARGTFAGNAQGRIYGFKTFGDYFTRRQLVALTTFADLVGDARARAKVDARTAGLADDGVPLRDGGSGAKAYGEAVGVYLGFSVDKLSDWSSSVCGWIPRVQKVRNTFARQAIPMTWDFIEINPLSAAVGNFTNHVAWVGDALNGLPKGRTADAFATAAEAQGSHGLSPNGLSEVAAAPIVCTDPPYYDNIGYADLSDFFYVWLRRTQRAEFPDLFRTIAVPKTQELVATPYRHASRAAAEEFFLRGMSDTLINLKSRSEETTPIAIYYAFKQSESDNEGSASTGWETFLHAIVSAGLTIDGTWPVRTERSGRSIEIGTNALASSIVLVCRRRDTDATIITRAEFLRELHRDLPAALHALQHSNIAPVDVAQAAIGPGMAIFSRHSRVLEADGSTMSVRSALQLINQALDEHLNAGEGDLDADTRFAITWFESHGFDAGKYGDAETLAKARNVSVQGVVASSILHSAAGKVRLLKRSEMEDDWDPDTDDRPTTWEATQHLIRLLDKGGEGGAAALLRKLGARAEPARALAYRLYSVCERKKWAEEARAYNGLVVAWPELEKLAAAPAAAGPEERQGSLFG